MNLVERRRAKVDPAKQRAAEAEARRQIALAVSLAEKKVTQQMEAALTEAEADKAILATRLQAAEQAGVQIDVGKPIGSKA